MCIWHADDADIENQLHVLANSFAEKLNADTVQKGDSVLLVCTEGTLSDRDVLLFPGTEMQKDAENAVLGSKIGEIISVKINNAEQTLTVKKIVRNAVAEINDELIKKAGIDGVSTVDEYRTWYCAEKENENREQAQKQISGFIFDEIVKNSDYDIDAEELSAWADEMAKAEFEDMLAMGEDPRIPDEGFDFLTDEEAVEKIKTEIEPQFNMKLVCEEFCKVNNIPLAWDDVKDEFYQMVNPDEISAEELEMYKQSFMENIAVAKVFDALYSMAADYLED